MLGFSWQVSGSLAVSSSITGFSIVTNPLWFADQRHGFVLRNCSRSYAAYVAPLKHLQDQPTPSFRSELERRGHRCIMFSKSKIQVGIPGRDVQWGPRTSRRLGPGLTKGSAVGSYFQAGIPALSFFLSCRDVRVSLFRRRYRLVAGPANSVSGLTRGRTFVATKL